MTRTFSQSALKREMEKEIHAGMDEIHKLRAEIERLHAIIQNVALAVGHETSPLLSE